MRQETDYMLSKLFYDLQNVKGLAARYRTNRDDVLADYALDADVLDALARDDVVFLAQRTNGFLVRYYFVIIGMSEQVFIERIRTLKPAKENAHG